MKREESEIRRRRPSPGPAAPACPCSCYLPLEGCKVKRGPAACSPLVGRWGRSPQSPVGSKCSMRHERLL